MKYTLCLLTLLLGGCISHYSNYQYDNGDDYVSEGTVRIVNDDNGKIGYATPDGIILIEPQYAFGYPFKNGEQKSPMKGKAARSEIPAENIITGTATNGFTSTNKAIKSTTERSTTNAFFRKQTPVRIQPNPHCTVRSRRRAFRILSNSGRRPFLFPSLCL